MKPINKVSLANAFASFDEHWSPRVGGDINNFQIKLVKMQGAFHWHHHEHEDELFLVISGRLRIRLRGQDDVLLGPGEYLIVPHGTEHCPEAEPECEVILLEPNTTLNTGTLENERTVRTLLRL